MKQKNKPTDNNCNASEVKEGKSWNSEITAKTIYIEKTAIKAAKVKAIYLFWKKIWKIKTSITTRANELKYLIPNQFSRNQYVLKPSKSSSGKIVKAFFISLFWCIRKRKKRKISIF